MRVGKPAPVYPKVVETFSHSWEDRESDCKNKSQIQGVTMRMKEIRMGKEHRLT